MSLTAFVTGGTGFVGLSLVRQLTAQGWRVVALVRPDSPLEDISNLEVSLSEGDITDAESVQKAMPAGVDAVFHVAASTNIWSRNNRQQTRINVEGTRNIVEASIRAGAGRLVHTSSFIVYGFHDRLLTEDSEWLDNAGWINYVRTKREAEQLVKRAVVDQRLDAVILNPAHILGPGDRHNWSRAIRLVNENKLPGVPPGGGSFADVREVAAAHIQAFHKGVTGRNYLLGGPHTQFLDVIRISGEILGRNVPGKASPAWLLEMAARVYVLMSLVTGKEPDLTPEGAAMITRHIECDSTRAVEELSYRFTPVRQLLEETCQWMRGQGMLGTGASQ